MLQSTGILTGAAEQFGSFEDTSELLTYVHLCLLTGESAFTDSCWEAPLL